MAGVIPLSPRVQFLDSQGVPLAGGFVNVYLAGSTTRTNTWADKAQSTLNENPIELDASGSCAIYVEADKTYKFTITDADGVTQSHLGGDNILIGGSSADVIAGLEDEVADLAAIAADISAVAAIDSDVAAVQDIAANVTTVAGISANVTTVAGISANVTTVAGVSANVTTVAGVAANVTTVATDIADVSTVATDIANVNTVANNIANVNQAMAAGDIYVDDTAGLAATASDGFYWIPGTSADEALVLRKDVAGVATATGKSIPNASAWRDELLAAAYARSMEEKRLRRETLQKPKAAIVILLGQSNNAARNAPVSGTVSSNAYMPAGGNSLEYFDFYSTNAEHVAHWDDIGASPVAHAEGAEETPCSGVVSGLVGGPFERVYAASVAIGARSLLTLGGAGPRCNLFAVVHKLCDHARAAGYEPVVMYDTHHGEAEQAASVSEADYYTRGWAYYRMAQAVAAQAMDRPDYDAPIVFHAPITMMFGAFSRGNYSAIKRLAQDIPNGLGPISSYQYDSEADRTHQSAIGFREKGEYGGRISRDFFQKAQRHTPVLIVDAVRSGATVTVTFNQEVTRDTGFSWGTNLNAANALGGFEFTYDGSAYVQVTAVAVQGENAILTLASDPGAHAATEEVRLALQDTTATLTAGATNRPGSQIRSNVDGGFLSRYDYTYRHYTWAVPQLAAVR